MKLIVRKIFKYIFALLKISLYFLYRINMTSLCMYLEKNFFLRRTNNGREIFLFLKKVSKTPISNYKQIKTYKFNNTFHINTEKKKIEYKYKDVNIFSLNGIVVPETQGYIQGEFFINSMIYEDGSNRFDFRFGKLLFLSKNKAVLFNKENEIVKYKEGLSLVGFASSNYYHFMIELLSKLIYFDLANIDNSVPIILDKAVKARPQFLEVLELININNRKLIFIDNTVNSLFNKLYVCDEISSMPINLRPFRKTRPDDFKFDFYPIFMIRKMVLDFIIKNSQPNNDKIYLCRKNQDNSRLVNEKSVVEILKKYGFRIIYTEEFSFKEQVELFWNAAVIIGATGAAFTNILFCNTNVKIFCINPIKFKFFGFSTIANNLGLQFRFINARRESFHFGKPSSSIKFSVNIKYLLEIVLDVEN